MKRPFVEQGVSGAGVTPPEPASVGIRTFASPAAPGFTGELKRRYTDFIVHEVRADGSVVELTDVDSLPEPDRTIVERRELPLDEKIARLGELVGAPAASAVRALSDATRDEAQPSSESVDLGEYEEKDARAAVHEAIREMFPELVTEAQGGKILVWCKAEASRRGIVKPKDRFRWPRDRHQFLRFTLYKENRETMQVVERLRRMLRVKGRAIEYAGTKDKRGVTTQEATVHHVTAERMRALNKALDGIRVGNFAYVQKGMGLGDHGGNRFSIALRNVPADVPREAIASAVDSLRAHGFVNYFGLQRFGTTTIRTHEVGAAIMARDYEKAIRLVLAERPSDWEDARTARAAYLVDGDAARALSLMPHRFVAERNVLQRLARDSRDFLGALQAVPRTLAMMYVHALQSFVWNEAASARIEAHGATEVVVGDLVFDGETPRVVRDAAECKTLKIEDVVLPLPGFAVEFPEIAAVNEAYGKACQAVGLPDARDAFRHPVSVFSLPGRYRPLLAVPEDVDWSERWYSHDEEQLIETDLERLQKRVRVSGPSGEADGEVCRADGGTGVSVGEEPLPGEKRAVLVHFTLGASEYATMCLRELCKGSLQMYTETDEPGE